MKTIKQLNFLTVILFTTLMTLTSCQTESDVEEGQNPNTNTANSETANNVRRSAMHDGSFDDFLDNNPCTSILLPATATVNGTQVNLITTADYQQVISILAQESGNTDSIELHFPLTVRLSNYTEVSVQNQNEYNEVKALCEQAENTAQDAISCITFDYPITLLTYNLNVEQTGSVTLEGKQQLFNYMSNLGNDTLFSINYPITATLNAENTVSITSDIDLKAKISDCLNQEEQMEGAKDNAKQLETILVDGLYKIESYVNNGVQQANDFADYSINFATDLSVQAKKELNGTIDTVEGTYQLSSEIEVFLNLQFSGNAKFNLLNKTWEVTSFSDTTLEFKSTTNAAITLVLNKI